MFCYNCGKEIDDKAVVCVGCGVPVTPVKQAGNREIYPREKLTAPDGESVPAKTSWIALASIFSAILALVLTIGAIGTASQYVSGSVSGFEYSGYFYAYMTLSVHLWGLIVCWVFTGFALILGITSTLICAVRRQKDKFRPFLALAFSVALLAFALFITIAFNTSY